MSLGGGGTTTRTEETRVTKLQISTSAYGVGKARVWGKQRVSGNMLWYGDFNAIPHTTTTSSGGGGGKGGGGSVTTENTSYTYTAGVMLALCSGTIAGVGAVWSDKAVTSLDALGLGLSTGVLRQAPWAHLTSNHPDQAVSYSGIAYVASAALALDRSASIPKLSFEVYGERIIPGGDDAYAQDVIYDVLCDAVDGLGMGDVLADTGDYALWCQAKGLTVALAATSQTAARDVIAQIAKATLSEPIRSSGKIKMVPYGDEPVGGWSPVTSPDYDLTESDLLEPPQHRRKQPSDATNRVTLNYSSRAKDYNTVAVTREDLSAVTQFGARPETIDLPCISNETQASIVCEFWRDRNLYIRNEWEIVVDERFCLIEAMDLLTITFGPQGLYREPVRVVEVTDDGSGKITLLVEEWPFGLLTATLVPIQPTSGYTPEYSVAPGDVNDPVILEAPNYLTAPNLEIWIGASGGEHWGGANVWVSDDNYSYQQVGAITNPARHGVLTSSVAEGDDPDTAHKLYVSLAVSGGQLLSGAQADADNGNTLCWVDGELIAYQNADLVAEHKYALSYLRRGMYGTASAGHLAQSEFLRIDGAVFKYAVPRERIGSPVWIKLQSFNKYGRSVQPLDTVTAYQYTIAGNKPLPLTSLTATGGLFEITLAWSETPGQVGIDYVEVWGAGTNNRDGAYALTSQRHPIASWIHPGLQPADTWYYWARVIDTSGNASDFYPASATGGVEAMAEHDPTALLEMLQGALGMPQLAAELAAPIAQIGGMATDILQRAIDIDGLSERVLFERAVTDATITKDPVTGKIKLLASAAVTTDVEARLTQAEVDINAAEGTITTTVATLETVENDLSSAQSKIAQLANSVALGVSDVQIADISGQVAGAITVDSAAASQALAESVLRQALGLDQSVDKELLTRSRVAVAEFDLAAKSNELQAEATARLALAAVVAQSSAALTVEQTTRAARDSALAEQISTVQAGLGQSIASVQESASASASAIEGVKAKWGVKVQTMQDGNLALAGIEVLSGASGQSTVGILADRFLIYRPDGAGPPKLAFMLGSVDGVTALGLDGSMVLDGSLAARSIAADSITADKIKAHTLTADQIAARSITADRIAAKSITADSGVIGDLAVGTLQIGNNAVTMTAQTTVASVAASGGGVWANVATCYVDVGSSGSAAVLASAFSADNYISSGSENGGFGKFEIFYRVLSPSGSQVAYSQSMAGVTLVGKGTETGIYSLQAYCGLACTLSDVNLVIFVGKK